MDAHRHARESGHRGRVASHPRPLLHVAPAEELAEHAVHIAEAALIAVLEDKRPFSMRTLGKDTPRSGRIWAWRDLHFVSQAVKSLFRWWGWIKPLGALATAERLLIASLLDAAELDPVARVWARTCGRPIESLVALANAPTWTARTEGFKRNAGRSSPLVDPWALFPSWFRKEVSLPPGEESPKQRAVALIEALQRPELLWLRAQAEPVERTWRDLRDQGLKPWIHRRIAEAGRIEGPVEVAHLSPAERGELETQDIASQAVGRVAAPITGQRWWAISSGRGVEAIHLAALMKGQGVVVASDRHQAPLKSLALHARRTPFRNLTTRPWDGKHVAGKLASFDGVLLIPPSSETGLWRRFPEARWRFDPACLSRLALDQSALLRAASMGVRPGGTLVYAIPSLLGQETTEVINGFLKSNPLFAVDPFTDPLSGATTGGSLQIWPFIADSDAWFVARLRGGHESTLGTVEI
jgi:16S rRNA (cytosine967-C5)-methyltransferase